MKSLEAGKVGQTGRKRPGRVRPAASQVVNLPGRGDLRHPSDKSNGRLIALCAGGARYEGSVFVDASYEGDLMAAAGVRYRVGREPRTFYCERWAGRQPAYRPGMHNFEVVISPFRQPGSEELLAGIAPTPVDELGWPEEALGEGDGALQA